MIAKHCFTQEWIRKKSEELRIQDVILEKSIYALSLVEQLVEEELEFVFKGGTSLLLHLDPVRRLSIDVDIACQEPLERVTEVLDRVILRGRFLRWEHQSDRDGENPPTRYFQLYYTSPLGSDRESKIQLDVLVEESPYSSIITREVKTSFLEIETPVSVRVPSVDCLLGDKLVAFAPKTVGILYQPKVRRTGEPGEPRPIRVMKQLFDVGELFMEAEDIKVVEVTHRFHFNLQNSYRGGGLTWEQALDDTLDAAYLLSYMPRPNETDNEETAFFKSGVRALNSHLADNKKLTFNSAKQSAARAALLAASLKAGRFERSLHELRQVPDSSVIRTLTIEGQWENLQRLRKLDAEAFYYWYLASRL